MNNRTEELSKHVSDKKYCVYLHKLEGGRVVYVGEGTIDRAYNFNRPDQWAWRTVFEMINPVVEIVAKDLTKPAAEHLERLLIKFHYRTIINDPYADKRTKTIPFDLIDEYVYYDESSPTFLRWKNSMKNNARADSPAGHVTKKPKGYCYVEICNQSFAIHRVVWVLHNREISEDVFVDHIDGNRKNNCILNLRLTNPKENAHNRIRKIPESGYRNIRAEKLNGVIVSYIVRWYEINRIGKRNHKCFNVKEYGSISTALLEAYKFRNCLIENGHLPERIKEGEVELDNK